MWHSLTLLTASEKFRITQNKYPSAGVHILAHVGLDTADDAGESDIHILADANDNHNITNYTTLQVYVMLRNIQSVTFHDNSSDKNLLIIKLNIINASKYLEIIFITITLSIRWATLAGQNSSL